MTSFWGRDLLSEASLLACVHVWVGEWERTYFWRIRFVRYIRNQCKYIHSFNSVSSPIDTAVCIDKFSVCYEVIIFNWHTYYQNANNIKHEHLNFNCKVCNRIFGDWWNYPWRRVPDYLIFLNGNYSWRWFSLIFSHHQSMDLSNEHLHLAYRI